MCKLEKKDTGRQEIGWFFKGIVRGDETNWDVVTGKGHV